MRNARRHIEEDAEPTERELDDVLCMPAPPLSSGLPYVEMDGATTSTGSSSSSSSTSVSDSNKTPLLDHGVDSESHQRAVLQQQQESTKQSKAEELDDFLSTCETAAVDQLGEKSASAGVDRKKLYIEDVNRADLRKNVLVYVLFAICFFMSVYTGVKTVVFEPTYNGSMLIGYLLGSGVMLINIEFFLL
eukprot:GSA25T00002487001.1